WWPAVAYRTIALARRRTGCVNACSWPERRVRNARAWCSPSDCRIRPGLLECACLQEGCTASRCAEALHARVAKGGTCHGRREQHHPPLCQLDLRWLPARARPAAAVCLPRGGQAVPGRGLPLPADQLALGGQRGGRVVPADAAHPLRRAAPLPAGVTRVQLP